MIHKEAWYREALAPGYTYDDLMKMKKDRLWKLVEKTKRDWPGQTQEEWFDVREKAYQALVERGEVEEDVSEDVMIRRQKWRDWYQRKVEEDPKYHQKYLQRVKDRKRKLHPRKKKQYYRQDVKRQKERYETDPDYAQKKKDQARKKYEEQKRRMQEDPAYAEEVKRKQREKARRYRERKKKKGSARENIERERDIVRRAITKAIEGTNLEVEETRSESPGSASTYWYIYHPRYYNRRALGVVIRYGLHYPYKGPGADLSIRSSRYGEDFISKDEITVDDPNLVQLIKDTIEEKIEGTFIEEIWK